MTESLLRAWRRVRYRWHRRELARELAEELDFHYERKLAENLGSGVPAPEAKNISRRQMGNITAAEEECWDMWSITSLERLLQDLKHASRMYLRTPMVTGICVLSIAIGIGGNAAMFSLVNGLLLRPLPYNDPDKLVRITGVYPRAAVPFFQGRSRVMDVAAVSPGSEANLTIREQPLRVLGSFVSPNFLAVLGRSVAFGRTFEAREDAPGSDQVLVISHSLWQQQFGGELSALGQRVRLDGVDREIVGILPQGFSYPSPKVQFWAPMRLDPSNFVQFWGGPFIPLIARIREGRTLVDAQADVQRMASEFRHKFPYPMPRDFNASSTAISLQEDLVGNVRGRLLILLASVAAVLLIAGANVTSILLSRSVARRKELALRAALGAGRGRIIRQLLTESVGLSATGAALGILLGTFLLSIFKRVLPAELPGVAQAEIDWPVIGAITGIALVFGLLSGLAPALSTSQTRITATIKSGNQRSTSGFWSGLRNALLAGEVALTLVLLVSAGLLLKSVYLLSVTDPGFDGDRIVTVRVSPNTSECMPPEACVARYQRLLQRVSSLPEVMDAEVANSVPLDGVVSSVPVDIELRPKTADNPAPLLWFESVSSGYLELLNIPLVAGRYFSDADMKSSEPVAILDVAAARRVFPAQDPIGKHVRPSGSPEWRKVVGVVRGVKHFRLDRELPDGMIGAMYMPHSQTLDTSGNVPAAMTLLAKVNSADGDTLREIEALVRRENADAPVSSAEVLTDAVGRSTAEARSTVLVFLSFAGSAMLLAAVGVYGLMSYWVSQRTYEIGLRLAVGCTRKGILYMIVRQGFRLTLIGVAGGVAGALMVTRFLTTQLYGVGATDPVTFVVVTGLILGIALLAMTAPAWRATRVDPLLALRVE